MKSIFKVLVIITLIASFSLSFIACGDDSGSGAVTGVTLNKTSLSLSVGNMETLSATVAPSNAANKSVTWSSSNPAIATVTNGGVVFGASAGSATITVKTVDGNKTATCAVSVTAGSGGNDGSLGATLTITNEQAYTREWEKETGEAVYTPFYGTVTGLNYIEFYNIENEKSSLLPLNEVFSGSNIENEKSSLLPLNEVFSGSNNVTLVNGRLSIRLGTPKAFALSSFNNGEIHPSVTISNSSAKLFLFYSITNENDNQDIQTPEEVMYMYVDMNVTISGTEVSSWSEIDGEVAYTNTYVYALDLKTGWNSVISTITRETSNSIEYITKTGKPKGDEKWVYNNNDW
jgi:hypothetical protein